MMNSKFIIECPGCKIRFFVEEDLLLEAGGLLRCGFCDHLFNGNNHIVYKTLDISKEELKVKNIASISPVSEKALVSDLDKNEESSIDDAQSSTDTNWDEVANTLASFSIDFNVVGNTDVKPAENAINASGYVEKETGSLDEHKFKVDTDILEALEDTDFDKLLQLDEQELLKKQASNTADLLVAPVANVVDNTITKDQAESLNDTGTVDSQYTYIENSSIPMDIHGNVLKKVSSLDFIPADGEGKKLKKRWVLWSFLCVLALLVLVVQYIRFVAPMTTSIGVERDWAVKACQILLCDVPPVVDVNEITTRQLVVRANPEYSNVLDVDAVIINQLEISQPFPIMELRFTDLNGQVVASRHFFPKDYLNDDLLSKNLMLSNEPVYITLSVIDPGETAVGYTLNYYEAN